MSKHRVAGLLIVFLLLTLVSTPLVWAQKPNKKETRKLLEFQRENVSQAEFERVYQKNNGGYEAAKLHTPDQFREYLDLYIKFKRKVFAAEDAGIHQSEAFQSEFEGYRQQLAQPYMSAKDVEDRIVREAYERSGYLVNAAHLLLRVGEDDAPEDTLAVYQKIRAFRDSITSGQRSFKYMAQTYSEDPSAKENEGVLGYFSAFDMVYPFESAAFNTPVGEVSQPVRTRFGYHLIKVADKKISPGTKHAAHIIIRIGDRYGAKDTAQAIEKINEIYQKLEAGEDFGTLARQHSDDPSTAEKGGELGTVRLLTEMEEAKIPLGLDEFSKPFSTRFGWHILKISRIDSLAPYDAAQAQLKQKIARDSRSQIGKQALIKRIKQEHTFSESQEAWQAFLGDIDTQFPAGIWVPDSVKALTYNRTLFSIGDSTYTLEDFVGHYQTKRPRYPRLTPEKAAENVYKNYVNQVLMAYEEAQLPRKNPEYRYLLKEYRDGILLFTLMEQKVWKKAVEDTVGLRTYYEDHKKDFYADAMVEVDEYRTTDESVIQQVQKLLAAGSSRTEIDSVFNQQSSLELRVSTQTYEKGKSDWEETIFQQKPGYLSGVKQDNGIYRLAVVKELFPPGIKSYDKARAECITRYQDHLEKEWLDELADTYPVKIDEKVFKKLFK